MNILRIKFMKMSIVPTLQLGSSVLYPRRSDHYVNATQLCSLALTSGGVPKRYPDWKRLPNTATFINEFVESMYYGIFKEKNALFLEQLLTSIDTEGKSGEK